MQKILITALGIFLASALTAYTGFFTLKAKTENVEKKVEEIKEEAKDDVEKLEEKTESDVKGLEAKTEEAEDKIVENEKIDLEQTILIKQISETLLRLNQKIDKNL